MDSHYFSSTCEHDADNLALFFGAFHCLLLSCRNFLKWMDDEWLGQECRICMEARGRNEGTRDFWEVLCKHKRAEQYGCQLFYKLLQVQALKYVGSICSCFGFQLEQRQPEAISTSSLSSRAKARPRLENVGSYFKVYQKY